MIAPLGYGSELAERERERKMVVLDREGRKSFNLRHIRMQSIGTVLQLSVRAKRFIEHFIRFRLRILCIGHDFFDADDLMTLGTLAEAMTGAIHFVLWSKPTHVGQFWFFHASSFP
jgi:hypothetical protein